MPFHGHPPLTAPPLGSSRPLTVTNLMPRTASVLRTLLHFEGCGTNLVGLPSLHFSLGSGSSSPHCLIGSLIAQTYFIYFLQLFLLFLVRVLVSNKPVSITARSRNHLWTFYVKQTNHYSTSYWEFGYLQPDESLTNKHCWTFRWCSG